jgi:Activator of Hsp90 ATPase homolog 1-like protein
MTTYENAPTVTPLRRPAVHASTLVRSDVTHTFDAFVRTIGAWWPVNRASAGRDRVRNVIFERERGGHVYETWDDGTTIEWGDVTVWEPHTRSMMTWRVTPVPTEVELTFTALGSSLTRVTVEHRGWEAMTDAQLAEDCGAPGGYSTGS